MTYVNSHENDIFSSKIWLVLDVLSSTTVSYVIIIIFFFIVVSGFSILGYIVRNRYIKRQEKISKYAYFLKRKKVIWPKNTRFFKFRQLHYLLFCFLFFLSFLHLSLDYTFFLEIETFFMLFITDQRCYLFPTSRVHFRFRRAAKCGKDTKWKMRTKKATSKKALPLLDSMHFIVCLKIIVARLPFW